VPLAVACVVVVIACAALQYGLRPGERRESEPSVAGVHADPLEPSVAAPPPSEAAMESAPVMISVELPVPDEEIEIFDIHRPRAKRARKEAAPANVPVASSRTTEPALARGPIAEAPALEPATALGLDLHPRSHDVPAPGEEPRL
jgi:hypothetical protein